MLASAIIDNARFVEYSVGMAFHYTHAININSNIYMKVINVLVLGSDAGSGKPTLTM